MKKLEQNQGDPTSLEQKIVESSKGDTASHDVEASYLRKQQLLAKAKVENLLIKYLSLAMGTNENLARTLEELDKIEVQARMEIDRAIAEHGEKVFTSPEIDHLMGQFKKHRPTESNVFPDEPTIPTQHIEQEVINPSLSSYDKLESTWLARKMSKWFLNRDPEVTERMVRAAKKEKDESAQQSKEQNKKQEKPVENRQEEKDVQNYVSEFKKWKGLVESDPEQARLHRMPFLAENAKEKAIHAYIKSGIENISLLSELEIGQQDIDAIKQQRETKKPETKKTSWFNAMKDAGRKFITRVAFTAAALGGTSTKTADTTLPVQDRKNITIEKTITSTQTQEATLKSHDEIISETPKITPQKKVLEQKQTKPKDTIQKIELAEMHPFATSLMEDVIKEINIENTISTKTNPDTVLDTPVGQTVSESAINQARVQDTIARITPAPLKKIETKGNVTKADTGKLKSFIQNLDEKEKKAVDQKNIKPLPTAPVSPNQQQEEQKSSPVVSGITFEKPTTTVKSGIQVTYQDKNGNALDTNNANKNPQVISPEAINENSQKQPVQNTTKETIQSPTKVIESTEITRRDTVGKPAEMEQVPHTPAVTAPASTSELGFYESKIPFEQTEREPLPVPEGWSSKPIDTNVVIEKGAGFKKEGWNIHEYRVRDIDGYENVPYFFWKKMDSKLWDAFKSTPGALEKYIKLSEREGKQDPYVIQLWDGNIATEYIVNENGNISAEPRTRTVTQPYFGEFTASLSKNENGAISVDGKNYASLNELEKQVLDMTVTQTGKNAFTVYSFHKNGVAGGGEVFDGNEFVIKEIGQIKKEIQDELNRIRQEKTIPLHRVEKKILEDGQTTIKVQWLPDEAQDKKFTERKVETVTKKKLFKKITNTSSTIKNRATKIRSNTAKKPNSAVVYDYSQQ